MTTTFLPSLFARLILSCAARWSDRLRRRAAARANRRRHGQWRADHQLRHRAAQQAELPDDAQAPTRQEVINELIDEKVKIKEAKKFGVDPGVVRYRSVLCRDELADADHAGSARPRSLEKPGHPAGTLKARIKAEMVWGSLVRGRFKESLQVGEKDVAAAVQVRRRRGQAETEGFEYQMRPIVLIVPRGSPPAAIEAAAKGSRGAARARADLRRGQRAFQVDAECRDPRHRRPRPRPTSRPSLREVLDKTPIGHLTAARSDQAGRRDGRAVRAQADHHRHAEEARNPRKDVRREVRGEVERRIWRKSAKPR